MPYEFLLVLVPVLVPAVASIFVAIITARSNRKIAEVQKTIEDQAVNNKQDAELKKLKDMVLGIGQATLVNECRRYVSQGTISKDDFEALRDHLYAPYKALNGNSTGDLWFGRVKAMYAKELK